MIAPCLRAPVIAAALAFAPLAGALLAQSGPAVALELDSRLELLRFNRAEGLSLGIGVTGGLRGTMTALRARARYAIEDERAQGMLGLRHTGTRGGLEVAAFSEMRDADPLAPGLGVTNTIPSALLSHDDGSYVFATGGEVRLLRALHSEAQVELAAWYADESAPRGTVSGGVVNRFPPNTPVLPGGYGGVAATVQGGEIGGENTWVAAVEGVAGEARYLRGWAGITRRREIGRGLDLALLGWAGMGGGSADVPQRAFRLGGARTLRGYDAGAFAGTWAWTVGADIGAAHRVIAPVVFADVGQARGADVAASLGAGVSVMRGLLRAHVATPIDRATHARFDLLVAARR